MAGEVGALGYRMRDKVEGGVWSFPPSLEFRRISKLLVLSSWFLVLSSWFEVGSSEFLVLGA